MLWRSADSSLACISLQRKKRKNGPKGIDFAQSCWYQDPAGCLQAFLLYSGQPGMSSRMLVTTDYVLCVCVCMCSKELVSFSKVPFSDVRKRIMWLSAIMQEKNFNLFCRAWGCCNVPASHQPRLSLACPLPAAGVQHLYCSCCLLQQEMSHLWSSALKRTWPMTYTAASL